MLFKHQACVTQIRISYFDIGCDNCVTIVRRRLYQDQQFSISDVHFLICMVSEKSFDSKCFS